MQITLDQAIEISQALDGDESNVRPDYSGRGMFGKSCLGITTHQSDILVGVALFGVLGEDAWEVARYAQTDNMGHSTIVYFPGVVVGDADTNSLGEHPHDSGFYEEN